MNPQIQMNADGRPCGLPAGRDALTSVSTFAGIGGFDLGFERAGIRTVVQVEQDRNCLNVLRRHWPDTQKITDVNHADRTNIPFHHVLAGGFPCQGASVAGEGGGLADDRTGLWFQLHRIAMERLPGVVVIENVPGLFSVSERQDFALVLGGLLGFPVGVPEQWRSGGVAKGRIYNVAWRVLDSRFFGVAQRRRRVFIVACHRATGVSPFEILFDEESLHWDCEASEEAREDTAETFACGVRSGGDFDDGVAGTLNTSLRRPSERDARSGLYIAGTINTNARLATDQNAKAGLLVADPLVASDSKRGTPSDSLPFVTPAMTSKWKKRTGGPAGDERQNLIAPTLQASFGKKWGSNQDIHAQNAGMYVNTPRVFHRNADCCVTEQPGVTAALRANAEHSNQFLMDRTGVRRLTPTECERLQGLPDGHTAEGVTENGKVIKIKDAPRYHMLGNAVTATVSEWIARRIVKVAGPKLLEYAKR